MVDNNVDAVLVQLLSAVCVRRDIIHTSPTLAEEPFAHILGTLGRSALARAVHRDGLVTERYQLHERWCKQFRDVPWEVDHVFPLHQWKAPLLKVAKEENWMLDPTGLGNIRRFFLDHYVTAKIPAPLHRILSRSTMPRFWTYDGPSSLWERYSDEKVEKLMGRSLRLPHHLDSDFVREP